MASRSGTSANSPCRTAAGRTGARGRPALGRLLGRIRQRPAARCGSGAARPSRRSPPSSRPIRSAGTWTSPTQWRARSYHRPDRGLGQRGPHARTSSSACPTTTPAARRGRADARSLCRRQRPGLRTHRRGRQPQPVLDGDVHLRHRGRPAERLGPRQRLPHHGLCHQPLHQARRRRQHPLQPDEHAPDDRTRSSACRR